MKAPLSNNYKQAHYQPQKKQEEGQQQNLQYSREVQYRISQSQRGTVLESEKFRYRVSSPEKPQSSILNASQPSALYHNNTLYNTGNASQNEFNNKRRSHNSVNRNTNYQSTNTFMNQVQSPSEFNDQQQNYMQRQNSQNNQNYSDSINRRQEEPIIVMNTGGFYPRTQNTFTDEKKGRPSFQEEKYYTTEQQKGSRKIMPRDYNLSQSVDYQPLSSNRSPHMILSSN